MAKAYEGNEPYIFISYSHKDSETVMPVIDALQERGFLVWFDGGIEAGSEWPEYIASHIDNCGCMLNFVSKAYEDSFHCRSEMVYALDRKKPFLSVYLLEDDTVLSSGLRMQLGLNQALWKKNFERDEDFYDAVCEARALVACKKGEPSVATTPSASQTKGTTQNFGQQSVPQQNPQKINQNGGQNANFYQQPVGNMQNQNQSPRQNAFINGNGYTSGNNMGGNYNPAFGNGAYNNNSAGTGYQNQSGNNFGGYQNQGQQNTQNRPMNTQGNGAPVSKLDAPVDTEGVYTTKKKGKGCLITFIILLLIVVGIIAAIFSLKLFDLGDLFDDFGSDDQTEDVGYGDTDGSEEEDPREGLVRHPVGDLVLYLPEELEEVYYDDDYASFESEDMYVSVLVEYFSDEIYGESVPLRTFGEDAREAFAEYGAGPLVVEENVAYFVYDDDEFAYFTALYKSSSAFWVVQTICYSEDFDEFEENFTKWAKLVETN